VCVLVISFKQKGLIGFVGFVSKKLGATGGVQYIPADAG
jgi:hypothetical protein